MKHIKHIKQYESLTWESFDVEIPDTIENDRNPLLRESNRDAYRYVSWAIANKQPINHMSMYGGTKPMILPLYIKEGRSTMGASRHNVMYKEGYDRNGERTFNEDGHWAVFLHNVVLPQSVEYDIQTFESFEDRIFKNS